MMLKRLGILLVVLFATGCVSGRVSTVGYSTLPLGGSFSIAQPKLMTPTEGNIQQIISSHMLRKGYTASSDLESADIVVQYGYNVGNGYTTVSSSLDYASGIQKVSSSTEYPRYFLLSLIDLKKSKEKGKIEIIWQGEVYSSGSNSNINTVAEAFIEEIFQQFGKTVKNKRFIDTR